MRTTRPRSAGLLLLLATAVGCGPPGLNGGQVDYLREDTLVRAQAPSLLSVMAVSLSLMLEDGTLDPALSKFENLRRVHDRVEALAPGCVAWTTWPPVDEGQQALGAGGSLRGATCAQAGLASSGDLYLYLQQPSPGQFLVDFTYSQIQVGPLMGGGWVRLTTTGRAPLMLNARVAAGSTRTYDLVFNGTARVDAAREWVELEGTGTEKGDGRVELPYRMEGVRHRVGGCAAEAGLFTLGPRDVRVTEKDSRPISQAVRYGVSTPATGEVALTLGDEVLTASYALPLTCRP